MTDNEIIKALGQCETQKTCCDCPYFEKIGCKKHLYQEAFDLINRQKAENEELRKKVNFLQASNNLNQSLLEKEKIEVELAKAETEVAKAEAVKEFAERLKSIYTNDKSYDRPNAHTMIVKLFDNIDNILKEMVGEDK